LQVGSLHSAAPFPSLSKPKAGESAHAKETSQADTKSSRAEKPGKTSHEQDNQLNLEQQKQLQKLRSRDQEVRAHEAAHKAAAGQYANGAASFTYQRGPNGQLYATGGEVGINTSVVKGDPEATVQKANQIRAAALAPAQPSSQDLAVASAAAVMATEARAEINAAQTESGATKNGADNAANTAQTKQYNEIANTPTETGETLIDLLA